MCDSGTGDSACLCWEQPAFRTMLTTASIGSPAKSRHASGLFTLDLLF